MNEAVKRVAVVELERAGKKRGKYNNYTPEDRARIGKYAAENGATRAALHFSKVLGLDINESTARKFKSEYCQEFSKMVRCSGEGVAAATVKSLPTKPQGRPLLLEELDRGWAWLIISTQEIANLPYHDRKKSRSK